MKPEWRRFAPIGIYLSVLATIVSIALVIIQREWNLYLQISLGLIVIGLALFAILDPQRVSAMLTGRQARYGSNAVVLSIAFIGILVVINYLVYQNSKQWDLTEGKQNTLAPETLDALQQLPQPVVAEAFYTSRSDPSQAENLLKLYQNNSKGKFTYKFIDPESDIVAAQNANIAHDATIVITMGTRQEQVSSISEQGITNALIQIMNTNSPVIYFLTGHGEFNPEDSGDTSLSSLKSRLEAKNYTVKTLNLLSTNSIPDDAKIVVIAGPTQPLADSEISLLSAFMDNGGSLIVMEESPAVTNVDAGADPLAAYLQTNWGIKLGDDIVIDLSSSQPFVAVANQYGSSPITQKMANVVTLYPSARSVQVLTPPNSSVTQVQLVTTAANSWAETDIASLNAGQQPTADPNSDLIGPVTIAATAQNSATNARLVVFGDADFASDRNFSVYGNGDMIVNTVDWASGEEALISLTPKPTTQRTLKLSPTKTTTGLLVFGMLIVLPASPLVVGVWVMIQRRRRG